MALIMAVSLAVPLAPEAELPQSSSELHEQPPQGVGGGSLSCLQVSSNMVLSQKDCSRLVRPMAMALPREL